MNIFKIKHKSGKFQAQFLFSKAIKEISISVLSELTTHAVHIILRGVENVRKAAGIYGDNYIKRLYISIYLPIKVPSS